MTSTFNLDFDGDIQYVCLGYPSTELEDDDGDDDDDDDDNMQIEVLTQF